MSVAGEIDASQPATSPELLMGASELTINIGYRSQACVLSATGGLDLTTADRVQHCAAAALNDPPDRLELGLAGLAFLDCAGARAMTAVAQAAPVQCPVAIRSVSSHAARLLGLLSVDLRTYPTANHHRHRGLVDRGS